MIRFEPIERLGVTVAAFSDKSDGDCRHRTPAHDRFCAACGADPARAVSVRQVHGTRLAPIRGMSVPPMSEHYSHEADGLATDMPGLPLTVFVADCAPIYLVDPGRRVVALIHAGWRGTFHGMSREAVLTLQREWQCRPVDLHALIGPSAGPCCYEVSPELAEQWRQARYPAHGHHLDLWETNARQLSEAGVPRDHIVLTRLCTICDGRFFSHRAEPNGARNVALLVL